MHVSSEGTFTTAVAETMENQMNIIPPYPIICPDPYTMDFNSVFHQYPFKPQIMSNDYGVVRVVTPSNESNTIANKNSHNDFNEWSMPHTLANVFNRMIQGTECTGNNFPITEFQKFQSAYEPHLPILEYLERIEKYSKCSESCLVIALIYIDRLIENRNLELSILNIHRILITSIMIAAKYNDDILYNNTFYAKIGGLPVSELNALEVELLRFLNFKLYVSKDMFDKYMKELNSYMEYSTADLVQPKCHYNVITQQLVDKEVYIQPENLFKTCYLHEARFDI